MIKNKCTKNDKSGSLHFKKQTTIVTFCYILGTKCNILLKYNCICDYFIIFAMTLNL